MGILKHSSIAGWLKQFGHSIIRFPVAVILLTFLSGYLTYFVHTANVPEKWHFFFIFYPATGALLAVSLQLLTEDFKRRAIAVITQVLVHALWLGISLYLAQFDRFSLPQLLGVFATVVSMVLSVFLLCFYRKGDDVPFWNFSINTLVAMVAGFLVGGLLTLGLILFVQSLEWLFGVTAVDYVYADIPAVCMVLLAPLLFMSQIPVGEEKFDRQVVGYSGFLRGVAQYLFIPLLALYLVTLYVYATKILISWQLPTGWVSYLVSASMLGMVVLLFITYPVQHEQDKSFFKTVTRWLPLAMLPLLALMTVAIGRRLSDYGITVSRLYLLVFNIWCYVVCIGLLTGRNKRIWWIPASFAAVLFLISVGPQSIANMTQRQLRNEAVQAFSASGIVHLPVSGARYDAWLHSVDEKTAAAIDSKLDYLETDYGRNSISDIVGDNVRLGTFHMPRDVDSVDDPNTQEMVEDAVTVIGPTVSISHWLFDVSVPQGYNKMTLIRDKDCEARVIDGELYVLVHKYEPSNQIIYFKTSVKELKAYGDSAREYYSTHPLLADQAAFVFDDLEVYENETSSNPVHITCSGILFTR